MPACRRVVAVVAILLAAPACARAQSPAPPAAPAPSTKTPVVAPPTPPPPTTAKPRIALSRMWPELPIVRPTQMIQVPDHPNLWYLAEQPGTIRLLDTNARDAKEAPLVADLRHLVNDRSNEEGLLSIAFHPDYPKKRELYVLSDKNPPRHNVLSRFAVSEDGRSVDPASETILLSQADPYWNHNGGTVLFGPDGYLYLSIGDGGAAGDTKDAGQDLQTFLAKVLRIDVNRTSDGKPYAIPADNPFVGRDDASPEIWAYGLRNLWRMHFDKKTGELWGGDVGQNLYEEIDLIVKGGNYGWRVREGAHPFGETKHTNTTAPIDPVVEYPRSDGISVTGGFVYRGTEIPNLNGVYLYADFGSSRVWGLRKGADGAWAPPMTLLRKGGSLWSSFAEAADGTLYLLSFEGDQKPGQPGAIWRIVAE